MDNIEQMDNVTRAMETLRQNQTEMLGTRNTLTEMKNAFDWFINTLMDMTKETINEFENMLIGIS